MINGFILILSFLISFFVSLYFLPLLIKVAFKLNIVDCPDNALKKHEKVTPYLGGTGIFLGFISAVALMHPFKNNILLFVCGCIILLLVGLIDDIVALTPLNKFIGQILATLCFLKSGLYLKEIFLDNSLNIIVSFFWFLTVINAFNLIDVMDGLSSIVALSVACGLLIFALLQQNISAAIILVAFIGSVAAFFLYNRPPAKMYMGDSGSLFMGGFLATIPFLLGWSDYNNLGFLIPGIILGVPLLELLTLIVVRSYKGIPFFKGSRHHFSLLLFDKGMPKNLILMYATACCFMLNVVALLFYFVAISLCTLLLLSFCCVVFWVFIVFFCNFCCVLPKSNKKT